MIGAKTGRVIMEGLGYKEKEEEVFEVREMGRSGRGRGRWTQLLRTVCG